MAEDGTTPPRTSVVLPAAGVGERMRLPTPKQFCPLLGDRPLISYTIEAFERIPWIHHIIVVVSLDWKPFLTDLVDRFDHKRVVVTEGAETRHRSIHRGVLAAREFSPAAQVLVIHDAVRPFVDERTIRDVAFAAEAHGASGVVRPLVSTVVARDPDGFLDQSLDRSRYYASEMPQGFLADVIARAYEESTDYDLDHGTECLALVLKYTGVKAQLLDGGENLWKVTHRRDLCSAETLAKEEVNSLMCVLPPHDANGDNGNVNILQWDVLVLELKAKLAGKFNRDIKVTTSTEYSADELAEIGCGSVIFFHQDVECESMCFLDLTERSLKVMGNRKIGVVIHVVEGCRANGRKEVVREGIEKLGGCRGVVCGVVLISLSNFPKLCEVVSQLVFDRNRVFSGQTFFV